MPDSEPSIVETPLVESERAALREFAATLPEWAIAVLIDSALWNLGGAEAERDRYREALERIADLGDYAARIAREALSGGSDDG